MDGDKPYLLDCSDLLEDKEVDPPYLLDFNSATFNGLSLNHEVV